MSEPETRRPDWSATDEANPRERLAMSRLVDRMLGESSSQAAPGERYEVLSELGAGGMGAVLLAHDRELDRQVALKFIRIGRASARVADAEALLLREARALARFSHPNVVKVFDVCAEPKAAYFVMEYIRGFNLRELIHRAPLGFDEVLRLLVQAGRGLAAAHREGLVHRDFKPTNVMVGEDGRVSVVDFGLVKQGAPVPTMAPSLATQPTLQTGWSDGVILGTPGYMAPELGDGSAATPASDQFAFCMAARSCLFGLAPPPQRELFAASRGGWVPEAPLALGRRQRAVWSVIARGLDPEPKARWPDMQALLDALRSGPRRGRQLVALGVLFVGVLALATPSGRSSTCAERIWDEPTADAVGSAFAGVGKAYADDVSDRVVERLGRYASDLREATERNCAARGGEQSARTDVESMCLQRLRAELDVTIRAILAEPDDLALVALEWVDALEPTTACEGGAGDPASAVPAPVREQLELANLRQRSADLDGAVQAARQAVGLAEAGGHAVAQARSAIVLARLLAERGDDVAARDLLEASYWKAMSAGDDDAAADAAVKLAELFDGRSELEPGKMWVRHAEAIAERGAIRPAQRVALLATSASLSKSAGDYPAALASLQTALELLRGGEHRIMAVRVRSLLGVVQLATGDFDRADRALAEAYAEAAELVGPGHPLLADLLNNWASVLLERRDIDGAASMYQRALDLRLAAYGPEHPVVAGSYNNLGQIAFERDDLEGARTWYRKALAVYQKLEDRDADIGLVYNNIANATFLLGNDDEAIDLHRRALDHRLAAFGEDHPDVAQSLANLGAVLNAAGRYADAAEVLERALAAMTRTYGEAHPRVARTAYNLADARLGVGDRASAASLAERALDLRRDLGDGIGIAASQWQLARAVVQADPVRARELATQAREGLVALEAESDIVELDAWLATLPN